MPLRGHTGLQRENVALETDISVLLSPQLVTEDHPDVVTFLRWLF